jgi:penicillin amidase
VWGGWGRDDRITSIIRLIADKEKHSPEDLKAIIKNIAFYDKRALNTKDLMIEILSSQGMSGDIRRALDLLARWDNLHLDADRDGFYDHPGAAIFDGWWANVISATFGDEFEGYKNVFGQSAVQILSDRYHGYTFFYRALQGKTKVDYFSGRKAEILQTSLKKALTDLLDQQKGKTVEEVRQKTAMDAFHPVSVLGYFLRQPITTSVGQLNPFPKVDRGTENHIVNLDPGNITGVNITAPGTSGFISRSGRRSKHLDDQVSLFVDFNYKPILFYRSAVEASQSEVLEIELN